MPYCKRNGLNRSLAISPDSIRFASASNVSISSAIAVGMGWVWMAMAFTFSSVRLMGITSNVVHQRPLLFEDAWLSGRFFDRDRFQHLAFCLLNLFPDFA